MVIVKAVFIETLGILTALQLLASAKEIDAAGEPEQISAGAVIREMNLARENPRLYAAFADELRSCFQGKSLALESRRRYHTTEGVGAIDEAVRFLRKVRPLPALMLSAGMCRAAADHCLEQAAGQTGHVGNNRSTPGDRINRYGTWTGAYGENISYGQKSARAIVLTLIIDDGVRSRGHRKNIFNPSFNYAGAAIGRHVKYQTVCSIDFAGGYAERDRAAALVARNP